MKRSVAVVFFVGVLLQASSAEAQILTGRILGVVRDESGALLPGTTATLKSPALPGGPIASVTNERGEFRFTQLQPGLHKLSLALSGFGPHIEQDLRVSAGGTIELTMTLVVVGLEQRITVSGRGPVVDSRQPGVVHIGQTARTCGRAACNIRSTTGRRSRPVFTSPSIDATQSTAQGVWAENEMTFGQRLTISMKPC
jgi:Carboxypeptidase regulatory-like domain